MMRCPSLSVALFLVLSFLLCFSLLRVPASCPLCLSTRSKQVILVSQILATICLSKRNHTRRIQPPGLTCAARRNTKTQRRVVHAVDDHALVLGAVLGPAADVRLDDIAAVQKRHLAVGLDPDLVARVLGEDGQRGNVQAELARLGELAEANAERGELFAFCVCK